MFFLTLPFKEFHSGDFDINWTVLLIKINGLLHP